MVAHLSERLVRPSLVDNLGAHGARHDNRAMSILVVEDPTFVLAAVRTDEAESLPGSSTSGVEDTEHVGVVYLVEVGRVELKRGLDDGLAGVLHTCV